MKGIVGIIVAGLCSAAVGCSSSSSSSGVSSGVDGSKTGETVTKEEAQKICKARNDYAASKVTPELACRSLGYLAAVQAWALGAAVNNVPADADLQSTCKDAVDSCVSEAKDDGETTTTDPCAYADSKDGCTATVTEMEGCLTALVDQSVSALSEIPACDAVTAESFKSTGESTTTTEQPAACDAVPATCGFGTNVDGGGGAGGAAP